jgi:hypothetical protein
MKRILYPAFLSVFLACQSAPESSVSKDQLAMQQTITDLESDLKKKGDVLDRELAKDLVSRYIKYHNQYHADTLSGEYMLRAASLSTGIGEYQQAIDLLISFYDGYPNSKPTANAVRKPPIPWPLSMIHTFRIRTRPRCIIRRSSTIIPIPAMPGRLRLRSVSWV